MKKIQTKEMEKDIERSKDIPEDDCTVERR